MIALPHPTGPLARYRVATVPSAPLATLRVVLGTLVSLGALRFVAEGWVDRLLGAEFRFTFYGFEWIPQVGPGAGYLLYAIIAASGIAVALGYRYRWAAPICLLSFAFAELQDATHYLNHYYLVVLLLGLLCVVPAGDRYSLDVAAGRTARRSRVPAWCVHVFIVQLAVVYLFAGLAKVNADWLVRAMPLAIWLPERSWWPVVGPLFEAPATAYAFSWLGCLYDLTIAGWLLWSRSRRWAYLAVVAFHGLTWLLFNIGLFPLIMIGSTLVFFSPEGHERLWRGASTFLGEVRRYAIGAVLPELSLRAASVSAPRDVTLAGFGDERAALALVRVAVAKTEATPRQAWSLSPAYALTRARMAALAVFFLVQLALPLRAYAYPGPAAWSEEGYRFGWRVMLVEKAGQAEFTVVDAATGRRSLVDNGAFLTDYQEKQMAIQPEFIRQFAHHLREVYRERHAFSAARVYVDAHVSLNGRRSRRLVDPAVDLAAEADGWTHRNWIEPFDR